MAKLNMVGHLLQIQRTKVVVFVEEEAKQVKDAILIKKK